MNTSEWITRSVFQLLPRAALLRNLSLVHVNSAQHALNSSALENVKKAARVSESDTAAASLASEPTHASPCAGSSPCSTRERLAGTLRHKDETLSPRLLRRTLIELKSVFDSQVSEVEGGRRADAFARWYSSTSRS
jgi:malonyl-CoA decarboxylase